MTIRAYLLEKNLKPLFIFKFNHESNKECFGVFVGSKGVTLSGDNGFDTLYLKWDKNGKKPSWSNETPLWIVPLKHENEKYDLNFGKTVFPEKIRSCFIGILNQPGKTDTTAWTDWWQYYDFTLGTEVVFSHFLNFEAKKISIEEKYKHTISESGKEINVWLFGDNNIKTTDRLIKFSGVECDIVNEKGYKHDFDIWCGIRNKTDDKENKNKIILCINTENEADGIQSIGTDCPIVWRNRGLLDDTIFPTKSLESTKYELDNTKLELNFRPQSNNDDVSQKISNLKFPNIASNKHYSWFIKEQDNTLSPFFRYINKNKVKNELKKYFAFNIYQEINFFQINRFFDGDFSKHIISWVLGNFREKTFTEIFEKHAVSKSYVSRSKQYSITPLIEKFKFPGIYSDLHQVFLEHQITYDRVSFINLKLFNPITNKHFALDLEKQTIHLPNLRLSDFKRKSLVIDPGNNPDLCDLSEYFTFESFQFTSNDIKKESDNGTAFGFSIKSVFGTNPTRDTKEGIFNDGSFSFKLDETGEIQGKIYLTLQLQKAQKPLYLWEWYEALDKEDVLVPCYSIEDFRLPISTVTPLATDLSEQERYIADDDSNSLASTGILRPTPPLIIPFMSKDNPQKYYLSLSENINVGQDFNQSAELCIRENNNNNPDTDEKPTLSVIVLGHQPQTAVKIETPFGTALEHDESKWIVARKNNLSVDGGVWEILNETANETGISLTLPPQVMGESFRKTNKTNVDGTLTPEVITGEPLEDKLVDFKFGPPTELQIANEQLNRQMVTAPWNIQHLFGSYGDSNPGLRLIKAQFELLYGMSANFENKDAFIAELENKLGQMVKAPTGRIVWLANETQNSEFKKAYSNFVSMLVLFNSRLAIYEVSANNKFQPAKFTEGINYFFRADGDKGAKLKWPFADKNGKEIVPEYSKDVYDKYHKKEEENKGKGLAGGFHFGFESSAVYTEVWESGVKNGSSSGEIENIAFTSVGGYGKQVARFAKDKSIIKSTTGLGRTHFYAVERIGRIGVLWNKAKHVVEYERTIVPSEQFKGTQNEGRAIVRKVREFVEILETERKYPEFGAEPSSAGSILGSHFKSIKIPVSSTWGNDLVREGKPFGWEVPLWNPDADNTVYLFPQIMLSVMASKESQLDEVLCNVANPQDIYFYTDVRDEVNNIKITSHTDQWPSVLNVDYTLQPFKNIYLGVEPCVDANNPKLINTPLPSPLDVLPGFERYTFKIIPSDVHISANGAYNKDSNVVGKLRTVTMQRKPTVKLDNAITEDKKEFIVNFQQFLKDNVNGYNSVLREPLKLENTDGIKNAVVDHIYSIAKKTNSTDTFKQLTDSINTKPTLKYLNSDPNSVDTFNQDRKADWQIPTVAVWFALTKELDAGIGAIDKNYTLLFKDVKAELDKLMLQKSTDDLLKDIKDRIESFKNNVTEIKSNVEINLNRFESLVQTEATKTNDYLEKGYGSIKEGVATFIADAKKVIDSIVDPATILADFKIKINTDINDKVPNFLNEQLDKINVDGRIKSIITTRVANLVHNYLINVINDYLTGLDEPSFELQKAKDNLVKKLNESLAEISTELDNIKTDLEIVKTEVVAEINEVSGSMTEIIKDFEGKLNDEYKKIITKINTFQTDITKDNIKDIIDKFFEKNTKDKFIKVEETVDGVTLAVQEFLIKDYTGGTLKIPPLACLFNQADQWLEGQVNDFKSFLNELVDIDDIHVLRHTIEANFDKLKTIYKEFGQLEQVIKDGNTNAIIKEANDLSQAINKDFGQVMGEVTNGYYKAANVANSYNELDNEVQATLFNYRSVFEEIKAVDLGFNRKTIELVYNFDQTMAPRLLLTPVMGKLQKLNDGLTSMGISIPYAGLEDKFVAPLKEWGNSFAGALAEKFPISNLLNDIGGIKFDNLFPFLKSDDAFFKAVKISHDLDKVALKAWVKADVDYTFTGNNTFMSIGPLTITMLKNARIIAQASESIDIERNRTSENYGSLKATFEISLSGAPLMLFKETVVSFKNGKYDFDLDPSRMEMPGLLKVLTDASQNIQTAAPASADNKKASPFKLEILKVKQKIGDKNFELPIGAKASLDILPLSIGGGPTSISNLSFGGNFIMKAVDDEDPGNLKLDFLVGLGFYLGKRDLPFNFTAFILGGGGYIDCSFRYQPSASNTLNVNFVMSVHASAAFAISAGWISGSIMILAGIEIEYISGKGGGTRIEIFIAIIGVVDILGLISIYLSLRLAINYLSNSNGTVLYGVGTVKAKIKICAFVTIRVSKSYTMILQGESKSVNNSRSEEISTSLN